MGSLNTIGIKNGFSIKEDYKITKIETVEENGQKIETAYNKNGKILKQSIFVDRNKDGKYELSEAVSIKFNHVDSRSAQTKEYKDLDNDGNYDQIVESDWTGRENILNLNDDINSGSRKMSDAYGSKNDTIEEWF